ncbi:MAG: hypothetical protein COV66_04000 [Nitrospinae bacterium CG11_big_fil_rev_8_21_14_0_20_45_15]|nr:MAG: hypothetical protein COV66_04000 [Nitrospinae bacterium CG11_big_fil_rev_8_21_14_0_20_45_15]
MSTTVVGNMQQVIQMTPVAEKLQDLSHQLVNVAAQQKDEDRAAEDELRLLEVQDPSESSEVTPTDPEHPKDKKRPFKRKKRTAGVVENDSSGETTPPPTRINEKTGQQVDLVV